MSDKYQVHVCLSPSCVRGLLRSFLLYVLFIARYCLLRHRVFMYILLSLSRCFFVFLVFVFPLLVVRSFCISFWLHSFLSFCRSLFMSLFISFCISVFRDLSMYAVLSFFTSSFISLSMCAFSLSQCLSFFMAWLNSFFLHFVIYQFPSHYIFLS